MVHVGSCYVGTISGNVADPAYVVRNAPGASSVARTGNLADLSGIATTPGQFPLTVDVTRAGTQIFGTTSRQVTVANPLAIVFNPATVPAISGPVTVTATAQNVVGSGGLVRQDDPAALAARGLTYANGVLSGTLGIGPAASLSLRLTDSADNTEVTASLSIPEIVAQPATIVIGDLRPGEAPMAANGSATPAVIQTQIQNPVGTVTQAVPGIEVSSSCVISGAPTAPGNYTLGVSIVPASNPQAAPVVVSAPVVVNPTLVASSPQPNASPVPGGAVNLVVNTSGVVGTPSFELVGVTPAQLEEVGLSFDPATGAIVGTVDPDVALSPQVRLTDSKDGKSTLVTFTVVTGPATVSTNMGTANLRGGDVRQYTASTNIANPVFSLVGAPDYVVIDPQTGGITLTAPAVTELTTIPGFAIRASNATRPGVFKQVPVNNPGTVRPELVLTISQNASARGNVAFELPYTTAGASNPQALFVDSGTLPTGVTIQAGRLAGTPTVAGSFSFALRFVDASDGRGVTRNVEIVVDPLLDFTLAGPVSPLGKGTVGTAFSVAASAQNALGTVTFENVSTTARPVLLSAAGLTITTAGVISGTPTAPTSGTLIQTAAVTYGFAHFPSGVSMGGYSYRSGTTFSIKNVSGTTVNLSRLVPSVGANPAVVYPWIGTPTSVTVPRTGNQSISFGAGGGSDRNADLDHLRQPAEQVQFQPGDRRDPPHREQRVDRPGKRDLHPVRDGRKGRVGAEPGPDDQRPVSRGRRRAPFRFARVRGIMSTNGRRRWAGD